MTVRDQWRDSIRPRIKTTQQFLAEIDVGLLAKRAGGERCGDGIALFLFATPLCITVPGFEVQSPEGAACREETQLLVLDYLARASTVVANSTTPPAIEPTWIGFQELPHGTFYAKAFRSYTSDELEARLNGGTDQFERACTQFGGLAFPLGDAAYKFRAFPHIHLALVWWAGDDEFPANATVLFDRSAARALPIDGMAVLGRLLCHGILNAIDDEQEDARRTIDDTPSTRSKNVEDHC